MRNDRDRDVASVRENLQREINDLKERQKDTIQHMREDADRRVGEVGKRVEDIERHHGLVKAQWESENRKMQSELDAARIELTTLRSKANPSSIELLNSVVTLKEGFESAFGGGVKEADTPNVKDVFLKQIGSFAVAAAERMQKGPPQPPQVQYVQVPGPSMGQIPAAVPPQAFAPPQPRIVQAAAIHTVPPPGTVGQTTQPQSNDAEMKAQVTAMFQFIEAQRSAGTPAESLAQQLIAQTSKETMESVLSYPVDTLTQIAVEGGVESLASPAADRYLKELRLALANALGVSLVAA